MLLGNFIQDHKRSETSILLIPNLFKVVIRTLEVSDTRIVAKIYQLSDIRFVDWYNNLKVFPSHQKLTEILTCNNS